MIGTMLFSMLAMILLLLMMHVINVKKRYLKLFVSFMFVFGLFISFIFMFFISCNSNVKTVVLIPSSPSKSYCKALFLFVMNIHHVKIKEKSKVNQDLILQNGPIFIERHFGREAWL